MIHAGIGQSHLNNLLSTLNIPQISHTSLKDREEEIGAVIETFANNSVDAALMQEKELAAKEMHIEDSVPGIEISSDAAWQKRGSQRSYNSLSGIASAIGKRTKKIVHYNSRYKRCRVCWYASKHQKTPRKHKCQLNWHGSAKAMEPHMFVEMVNDITNKGIPIAKVAGEDDHTGITEYISKVILT